MDYGDDPMKPNRAADALAATNDDLKRRLAEAERERDDALRRLQTI